VGACAVAGDHGNLVCVVEGQVRIDEDKDIRYGLG
jgi:hypothetical protein